MEISVYPRTFGVQPTTVQTQEGERNATRVTILDVSGTIVHVTFAHNDWLAFQRAVVDPEAFAEEMKAQARQAEARSRIAVVPAGTVNRLKPKL